jgi:maltooligosyltrehalose trehalohydrolase
MERTEFVTDSGRMIPGARYLGGGNCEFTVWAPLLTEVAVNLVSERRVVPLRNEQFGYWRAVVPAVAPGAPYLFRLGGGIERPDPASNYQPEGVHGPSHVVDHGRFEWDDAGWGGMPLDEMVIYELHTGTFTPEGTFAAIIPRLRDLRELGITTVELMPAAQFPGDRNWGYDGVYPYAAHASYGGPDGLKKLVRACHADGLAVILDVVHNHLGPEGNYLRDFGPYFTDRYKTPWGEALNFDGEYSHGAREFFIQNALYWFHHFHIDALRLDAVHSIHDMSARHFLRELAERAGELSNELGRKLYLIAESDLNDPRLIWPAKEGGYGLDAQWCDEFHHSLHALLTGERAGYYSDFGRLDDLAKSYHEGYVYTGQYSKHRRRFFGGPPDGRSAGRFAVFTQNHDQVGNRMLGERLSALADFEKLKLAAGATLLAPHLPLIFMGEEYGEDRPFLYFVSHSDPALQEAVRSGRKAEFERFQWRGEPPDPNESGTFLASKLGWEKRAEGSHGALLRLYRRLIELRHRMSAMRNPDRAGVEVTEQGQETLLLRWCHGTNEVAALFNFSDDEAERLPTLPEGVWVKLIDSAGAEWDGPGSSVPDVVKPGQAVRLKPHSFILVEMS